MSASTAFNSSEGSMNVDLILVIDVDYDPNETSWQLVDDFSNTIIDSTSVGTYTQICKQYRHEITISYDHSYTFTIRDSFGDGMSKVCTGDYYMAVLHTDERIFFGGGLSFTFKRSHTFVLDQPQPSPSPSTLPSASMLPSYKPSYEPSSMPSKAPTSHPSSEPSAKPSQIASSFPSMIPSVAPTIIPSMVPSFKPSLTPSEKPSMIPSVEASMVPSVKASIKPSVAPTIKPSVVPTIKPSVKASIKPSVKASIKPSVKVSIKPPVKASTVPSIKASITPSIKASITPSEKPSLVPSVKASITPSIKASIAPSIKASIAPSEKPSLVAQPSLRPSSYISTLPSSKPSSIPSNDESVLPSKRPSSHPSITPSSPPKENPYTLIIDFDQNPQEIAWKIVPKYTDNTHHNFHNRQTMYGESFGHYNVPCIREEIEVYLIVGISYTFTIYDQKGNGMTAMCNTNQNNTSTTRTSINGGNLTSGYALYRGTTEDLSYLVWERDGDSFTDVNEEIIVVPFDEPSTSPSKVPISFPSSFPSESMHLHTETSRTIRLVAVGSFAALVAVASVMFLVFGFVLFKMCGMRQKGRPIRSDIKL